MTGSEAKLNRRLVLDFYRDVFWAQDSGAVERFVTPDVRVHAPAAGEGLDAMVTSVEETFTPSRPASAGGAGMPEPAILVADGDLVAVAFYMPQVRPERAGGGVVDYFHFDAFRIRDGKLCERWPSINQAGRPTASWSRREQGATRPRPSCSGPEPEVAKRLAVAFYREVFDAQDAAAAARFVTEDYYQHAAHYPQGRDGLERLLRQQFPNGPRPTPATPTLPHVLLAAERDIVVTAGLLPQPAPSGDGTRYPYLVYTAYAVRDGMLAEHWSGVNTLAPPVHSVNGTVGDTRYRASGVSGCWGAA
jgi:predicted SnoaL-like aldol condensation-catalyzing enzyme